MPPPYKTPRSLGTALHKDKSLELFRDAGAFLARNFDSEDADRVLMTRLATRPTLILGSAEMVDKFLRRPNDEDFYNGLKDFFFGLFGPSILFCEGAEAAAFRSALLPLFDREAVQSYGKVIDAQVDRWIEDSLFAEGREEASVTLYEEFKRLSLEVNLKIFLGVDPVEDRELLDELSAAATAHWHGIISVPLNVKVPLFVSSSYRRALEAKERLLGEIRARMASSHVPFLDSMKESPALDDDQVAHHVLIFACALIPKGAASILTSMMDAAHLWHPKFVDAETGGISDDDLDAVLTETVRLWPPFLGSLRVAARDAEVGGSYAVAKGQGVFCATWAAHRDPLVFPYPERFLPERWRTFNSGDRDKLFGFGAGTHGCVGERFMWRFLKTVAAQFVRRCQWDLGDLDRGQERKLKYLPCLRPTELEEVRVKRREKK